MKKLFILSAASIFVFFGASANANAQSCRNSSYRAPARMMYASGYQYGRPVYIEKYLVGYDCYGRPVYNDCSIQSWRGHAHASRYQSSRPVYRASQCRTRSYYSNGHDSSGTRVTFRFGR